MRNQLHDQANLTVNETADSCNNTGVRIYKPKNGSDLPLIIFIHGGGLIAGNLDTEDAQCRHLAAETPCIVMSIDYPKVTTSGVVMDTILQDYCIPAVPWCRKRGQELGANVSKTVLCGGSMGSTLSAATAYHYIQKGDTESITGLILPFTVVYPYDYQNERYTAWKQYGDGGVPILSLDLAKHIWCKFFTALRAKLIIAALFEIDFKDPKYLPGLAEDLSKWPPTYMISAEKDVCRDDGILFNEILQRAGRKSKLDFYDGLPHYFHCELTRL